MPNHSKSRNTRDRGKTKRKKGRGAANPLSVRASLRPFRFTRNSVMHFDISGTATTTAYSMQNDCWTFSLLYGLTSQIGKFVNDSPGVISTLAYAAIPQSTEFLTLFDQYRIRAVHLKVIPLTNVAASGSVGAFSRIPTLYYSTNDYNSITPYSTLGQLLQREDCKVMPASKPFELTYRPKPLMPASDGTATIQLPDGDDFWISTSNATLEHSGIQVYFDDAGGSDSVSTICVIITYDLEFRAVA